MLNEAKTLRLWHWKAAMSARGLAQGHTMAIAKGIDVAFHEHSAARANKRANFHIKAVQVLNDHPNTEGSYATDDAK